MAKPQAKAGPSLLKKDAGAGTIQKRVERSSGPGLLTRAIEAINIFRTTVEGITELEGFARRVTRDWCEAFWGKDAVPPTLENKECDVENDCYEIAIQLRDLVQVQRLIGAQMSASHKFYVKRCEWDVLAHEEHMKALSHIADKVENIEKRIEQSLPPAEEWSELACDIRQSIENSSSVLAARIAQHHHGLTGNKLPGLERESGTCNKVKIWDTYTPIERD